MQHNDILRLSVLFVIGKTRFYEEFFANKFGRRMAALADFASRTKVLHRRRNRRGIAIHTDFDELFRAVHFRPEIRSGARADVAFCAIHMRMRGDFVGGVFGMHHVAGLTAELRGIHVGSTAISCHGNDKQVYNRSHQHDVETMTEYPIIEIDLGKYGWDLARFRQLLAAKINACRNQQQPKYEKSRQEQEEDDSEIGVDRANVSSNQKPIIVMPAALVIAPPAKLIGLLPKNSAGRTQFSRNR